MVKMKEPIGRPVGVKYVYDNDTPEEAEFIGMFSNDGVEIEDREITGERKPDEYLFAVSPKGRNLVPSAKDHVESHSIILKDGRTGYWFSVV